MALIDLGERREAPPGESAEGRLLPRIGRPARAVLLVALLLATLTGAVPAPESPAGVSVPARRGVDVVIAGDRLYLVDPFTAVRDRQRFLTAFTLPAVKPLWQVPLPLGEQYVTLRARDDLLLLVGSTPGAVPEQTIALAPTTGQQLWRRPGRPLSTEDGGVLLRSSAVDGWASAGGSTTATSGALTSVEPRSGGLRWSRPISDDDIALTHGGPGAGRLVVTSPSGRGELLDSSSGAVLDDTQLLPPQRELSYHGAQLVGDLLVIRRQQELHAYGSDRLDPRWRKTGEAADGRLTACAVDSICLLGARDGLALLDSATGRVRWRDAQTTFAYPLGDRLVAARAVGPSVASYLLLDPATGQVQADLGVWEVASNATPGARLIGLRPTRNWQTLVVELDPAARRTRALEVLPGLVGSCHTDGRTLACPLENETLGVWRLDR